MLYCSHMLFSTSLFCVPGENMLGLLLVGKSSEEDVGFMGPQYIIKT